MANVVISPAGVLHFADWERSAERPLLVFAGRLPSAGLLDALCAAVRSNDAPLSVVCVGTIGSALKSVVGRSSPWTALLRVLELASERGVVCQGEVLWDVSVSAGVVRAVRRTTPRLVCVVPSTPRHSQSMRRALAFVGRLVEGRLVVADERSVAG